MSVHKPDRLSAENNRTITDVTFVHSPFDRKRTLKMIYKLSKRVQNGWRERLTTLELVRFGHYNAFLPATEH